LVFNVACRLCTWCFPMQALRWQLIKIQRASQWDRSCSRIKNQHSSSNEYLSLAKGSTYLCYVHCCCCVYWSFKAFFQFIIVCEVCTNHCVERFCSSSIICHGKLWKCDCFIGHYSIMCWNNYLIESKKHPHHYVGIYISSPWMLDNWYIL